MMGFPHGYATQAFKKCKTSVIGDVIDIIVQLQTQQPLPKESTIPLATAP
jgi:hypothetical protein